MAKDFDSYDCFTDQLKVEGINFRGYGNIPKFVMFDIDLSLEAKAIYAYFCSFSGSGNVAFPCRDKILADLRLSKDGYYNHFNQLTGQGYITVVQLTRNGKKSNNVYTLISAPQKFLDYQLKYQKSNKHNRVRHSGIKSLGYGSIPKAVMQDKRLSIKSKGIYAFFTCLAGNGDTACPSRKDTLYYLQISAPTYYTHYQPLIDFGYIITTQRHENGVLGKNDYYINDTPDLDKIQGIRVQVIGYESENDQCIKNQDTENQDTVSIQKPSQTQSIQGFDQCTKNQDTEIQDTEIQDSKINSIKKKQYKKNQSIIKNPSPERTNERTLESDSSSGQHTITDKKNVLHKDYTTLQENITATEPHEKILNDTPPSDNLADRIKAQAIVYASTNYENICKNYNATPVLERDEFKHAVFCLFNEALITMLSSDSTMNLNRMKVSKDMVYEKFAECLKDDGSARSSHLDINDLIELVSNDYEKGVRFNNEQGIEIKNKLQYMKSCIWNALLVGKIGLLNTSHLNGGVVGGKQNQPLSRTNRFVNFKQREIDFDEIERMERALLMEAATDKSES